MSSEWGRARGTASRRSVPAVGWEGRAFTARREAGFTSPPDPHPLPHQPPCRRPGVHVPPSKHILRRRGQHLGTPDCDGHLPLAGRDAGEKRVHRACDAHRSVSVDDEGRIPRAHLLAAQEKAASAHGSGDGRLRAKHELEAASGSQRHLATIARVGGERVKRYRWRLVMHAKKNQRRRDGGRRRRDEKGEDGSLRGA